MYKNSIGLNLVIAVLFFLLAKSSCSAQPTEFTITVGSGAFDRSEAIVSFYFPLEVDQGLYKMESETGTLVDLQVDDKNRGWFILDSLAAGSYTSYTMTAEPKSIPPKIIKHINKNTITFKGDGRDILTYYHKENTPPANLDDIYRRGGYIHPVYSPDGVTLTNHFNLDAHPHQYGIWSAWTNTRFQGRTPDFWNVHALTGRIDNVASAFTAWEGTVHAGFRGLNHFLDLSSNSPVIALNEEWVVTIYRPLYDGNYFIFDLKLTQTTNSENPLILPEYRYGGVGFRGHEEWNNPDKVTFLTSSGLGRDGHATRARWCHIGGYVNNELAGITIMGSPKNERHPQPMRIHPEEPFFNFAPTQLGEMSIKPGSPYVARYRYVTYDGEVNPDEINRIWNDFAYPPEVTVVAK